MSDLEQLYQQVILDHAKRPVGVGLREPYEGESFQVNPTCGDEVRLRVHVVDGVIEDISWEGQGCSISQASVSVLSENFTGEPVSEFEVGLADFRELMDSRGKGIEDAEERLGDGAAFTGVSKFPARIKCALLGWLAAQDALIQAGAMAKETS